MKFSCGKPTVSIYKGLQVVNTMACPCMTTSPSISSATRLSETPRGAPCASTNRLEACECYDCYCRHPEVQGKVPRTRWKRLIWTFQAGKAMPHCWQGDHEIVAGPQCTATVQDTNLWTIGLWTTQTKSLSWASR